MKREIVIDARGLEPPEPMERVLKALAETDAGVRVRFLIHREPFPLYPLLSQMNCEHQSRLMADGSYEILITRP